MSSKSNAYWRKREAEALKGYIKDEKEYDKQVKKIYQNQLDAIQTQINAFYGTYAAKEGITIAEAKKRVSKLDIAEYERKAAKYVKEKNFSAKANEEMRLYNATMKINRLEMLKANIGLEMLAGTDELDRFMAKILKGRTEDELKRQAGILGKTIKNNARLVDSVVNASFHNATFSDRIWTNQALLRNRLSGLLQSGMIQGKNPRVLAREIKKEFNTSTYNAERLMRTELARVQTEAAKQSFEQDGFDQYEFIANSSCCGDCQALNGKIFEVKKIMPGENAAPIHPNCRCAIAPYNDRAVFDAWLDHLEKGGTTDWDKFKERNANKYYSNRARKIKTESDLTKYSKSSIIDMLNYEEVTKHFKDKYNIDVSGFENKKLFNVKCVLAGVDDILSAFSEANKYIKTIIYNPNKKHYGSMNRDGKCEIGPLGLGDYGTGLHEAAHALDYARSDYNTNSYSERIIKAARKKLGLRKNSREYMNLLFQITGIPYEDDADEVFAYSIESELGGNSNKLSKAIYQEVERK